MDWKYCSICFVTDVKMYSIEIASLEEAYLDLLDNTSLEYIPGHFCYECSALLLKYKAFRTKCLKAQEIMSMTKVSPQTINSIDRVKSGLVSKLSSSKTSIYDNISPIAKYIDISGLYSINPDSLQFIESLDFVDCEVKEEIVITTYDEDAEVKQNTSSSNIDGSNNLLSNTFLKKENDIILNENLIKYNIGQTNLDAGIKNEPVEVKGDEINPEYNRIQKKGKRKVITEKLYTSEGEEIELKLDYTQENEDDDENISNEQIDDENECNEEVDESKTMESSLTESITVVELTPEESKLEVLSRKESNNYKKSPYKCDFCYRGYEFQHTFENHMKRHTVLYGKYSCEFCHFRYRTPNLLQQHIFNSHKRKIHCNLCPYVCFKVTQARHHYYWHKGQKYPCKACDKTFCMRSSLSIHVQKEHSQLVCDICGKAFQTEKGLNCHKKLVHVQEEADKEGPECVECGVHFVSDSAYKRHLVFSNKHQVTKACKLCGETFPDMASLRNHSKQHRLESKNDVDAQNPISCAECDKELPHDEFKFHMKTYHPDSAIAKVLKERRGKNQAKMTCVCELCGKAFRHAMYLEKHIRNHIGERPFKCRGCGKGYGCRGDLRAHTRFHCRALTTQRFACDLCEKHFCTRSALSRHVKVHLGIKPYHCPLCTKTFVTRCEVKYHLGHAHGNVPWPKKKKKPPVQETRVIDQDDN